MKKNGTSVRLAVNVSSCSGVTRGQRHGCGVPATLLNVHWDGVVGEVCNRTQARGDKMIDRHQRD